MHPRAVLGSMYPDFGRRTASKSVATVIGEMGDAQMRTVKHTNTSSSFLIQTEFNDKTVKSLD